MLSKIVPADGKNATEPNCVEEGQARSKRERSSARESMLRIKTFVSHSEADDRLYTSFLLRNRLLIAKCFIFPLVMSWYAVAAWPGVNSEDAVGTLEYQIRWVNVSSEIFTYYWVTMFSKQAMMVLGDCMRLHKRKGRIVPAEENYIEYPIMEQYYSCFFASFIALLTCNPFVFLFEAVMILINMCIFRCRVRMIIRSAHELQRGEMPWLYNTAPFVQNARLVFLFLFVPTLICLCYFILVPFGTGESSVAFGTAACVAVVAGWATSKRVRRARSWEAKHRVRGSKENK